MKIIAVYGASGSGKTTYIEKDIIKGCSLMETKAAGVDVSMHEPSGLLLYGKYNTSDRCKGCDKLSMSIIDALIASLYSTIEAQKFGTIVIDGDRVNNGKMFQFLLNYKEITEIVFIDTPLEIIFKRLTNCNKQFVKTTFTKTQRMIAQCNAAGMTIKHIKAERPKFGNI